MKIKIKRIDKTLPLPERKTEGAAAFDLVARKEIVIPSGVVEYVPLNVILAVPDGFVLHLFARSGTHKKGLILANGVGVIDSDYCGNDDEVTAAYYNFSDAPVTVERGERIAQGIIRKYEVVDWEEVELMEKPSRGGFGTTGKK